ncbi:MAG: PIN domain nuclease [Spirochaetales bacterium]|nr:PIN domain nuclease [Spirochaetales bacterium]
MILMDTSVLIEYFKGKNNICTAAIDRILKNGIPFGINDFIYQEILQGARTIKEFQKLKEYLETIPFYHLNFGKESFEKAALINLTCRKAGYTVRSTIDLIIVETAIENDLFLLHNDNDFNHIAEIIPELKIYETGE